MNEEEKVEAKKNVAEMVTEKPNNLIISVKPKNNIHQLLMRLKLSPSEHLFEIKPQRVINVYRIAGRAVGIDLKGINPDPKEVDTLAYGINIIMDLMQRHGEDIIYIVACAVQNNHLEPTEKMLDIVRNDFEFEDIFTVLTIAVSNYKIASFLNSIVLIKGVDNLNTEKEKTSPATKTGV